MKKKNELAKEALENPSLFSFAELAYFKNWLAERKRKKKRKEQAAESLQGDAPH